MIGGPLDPSARERLRGHCALLGAQVCFGLFPVFGKWAFASFAPLAVAVWRIAFGAAATALLALAIHGRGLWPGWRHLRLFALVSLLGVTANQALYLAGLARSTAVNAGLVMCLIPVFTFAVATLFRAERLQPLRAFGLALALAGAAVWYLGERPELVRSHALGNGLMVLNTLCYAVYLVFSRPLARRHPPLVALAWIYLLALPALPLFARGVELWPRAAPARAWWSLGYVLVFPTLLAYLWNVYALRRLSASTTAAYVYLQPLVSGAAGAVLLGEELTPAVFFAAALVFAGIWLVAPPSSAGFVPRAADAARAERSIARR